MGVPLTFVFFKFSNFVRTWAPDGHLVVIWGSHWCHVGSPWSSLVFMLGHVEARWVPREPTWLTFCVTLALPLIPWAALCINYMRIMYLMGVMHESCVYHVILMSLCSMHYQCIMRVFCVHRVCLISALCASTVRIMLTNEICGHQAMRSVMFDFSSVAGA